MPSVLPLAAAALLPTILIAGVLARTPMRLPLRAVVAVLVFTVLLVPFPAHPVAQSIRAVIGDLSITSTGLMLWYLGRTFVPAWPRGAEKELAFIAAVVVWVAAWFYPLASGLSTVDPYAHGYYPTVLTAVLLSLLGGALMAGWYLSGGLIVLSFIAYAGGWLESGNLWDYLFDPLLVAAAIVMLVLRWRDLAAVAWREEVSRRFTAGALVTVAMFLAVSVVLAQIDPEAFAEEFTVEDGFVESVTALTLFGAFCFSVRRFVVARHRFGLRGRFMLVFAAALCLFGAGEEISWGQRILGFETPEAWQERNAQDETNLHNLTFEWKGETVKVNRLVFGRGLALGMVTYVFVLAPLYRRRQGVRRLVDSWAIPIPTKLQTGAYVFVIAVVELLIDSPKRGEMTEFAGVIVATLNLMFPENRHIFRPTPRRSSA